MSPSCLSTFVYIFSHQGRAIRKPPAAPYPHITARIDNEFSAKPVIGNVAASLPRHRVFQLCSVSPERASIRRFTIFWKQCGR